MATDDSSVSRREAFARMVTHPRNPYFRPAVVNKVWSLLLGRAIVSMQEDLSEKTAVRDQALLALLAKGFSDLKHDMRDLVRAIAKTRAYGRTSRGPANEDMEACHAKAVVRPIDGRPLARSLASALFLGEEGGEPARRIQEERFMVGFERLFGETNLDPRRYEETVPQALKVMNQGPLAAGRRGQRELPGAAPVAALGRLLDRFDAPRERVTRIYLSTVARPPTRPELDLAIQFLEQAGGGGDAYEDLVWALVNSSEFRFNR
jgi:hypothetical protein